MLGNSNELNYFRTQFIYTTNIKTKMTTATKPKRSDLKIQVTDEITRALMTDFKLTGGHIRNCLKFYTNSPIAKKVRKAAIKKMEAVMLENEALMNGYQ
jgi:hypothetical protein